MSNEFKLSYTANDINTRLGYLDGITENVQDQLENVTYSTVLAMKGSLKWDGVVGDKTTVTVEQGDGGLVQLVHIYDEVPVITYPMALVGVTQVIMPFVIPVEEFEVMDDGFAMIGEGFVIVPYDNYSMEGLTFPKKGIYAISYTVDDMLIGVPFMYASALLLIGYSFPDNGADKYFESGSSTTNVLTFDGNIGDKTKVLLMSQTIGQDIMDVYHVKLSDSTPTMSDLASGANITMFSSEGLEEEFIPVDDIMLGDDGAINIGDLAIIIIPSDNYTVAELNNAVFPKKGTYAMHVIQNGIPVAYVSELSIPNYTFQVDRGKVLKAAHMPEPIIFTTYDNLQTVTCNKSFDYCKNNPYQQCILKAIDVEEDAYSNYSCLGFGFGSNGKLSYMFFAGLAMAIVDYKSDGTIEGMKLQ